MCIFYVSLQTTVHPRVIQILMTRLLRAVPTGTVLHELTDLISFEITMKRALVFIWSECSGHLLQSVIISSLLFALQQFLREVSDSIVSKCCPVLTAGCQLCLLFGVSAWQVDYISLSLNSCLLLLNDSDESSALNQPEKLLAVNEKNQVRDAKTVIQI